MDTRIGRATWVSWPVSGPGGCLRRRVQVQPWSPPPEDPLDEVTGDPLTWEPGHVRARLREAMDTLRRLPMPKDGRPRILSSGMPEVVHHVVEAYGYAAGSPKTPVPRQDIGRLDEVLDWLMWLPERQDAIVVTAVAMGLTLRNVGRLVGRSHEWCRRRERAAVAGIAERLNQRRRHRSGSGETMSSG